MTMIAAEVEAKAAGFAIRNLLWIGLAVAVVIAIGVAVYFFIIAPMNAKNAVATAHGTAAIGAAGNASAQEAIAVLDGNTNGEHTIAKTTETNHVTIIHAPGASNPLTPELAAAGRAAYCLRESAAHLPGCQPLLQTHP